MGGEPTLVMAIGCREPVSPKWRPVYAFLAPHIVAKGGALFADGGKEGFHRERGKLN